MDSRCDEVALDMCVVTDRQVCVVIGQRHCADQCAWWVAQMWGLGGEVGKRQRRDAAEKAALKRENEDLKRELALLRRQAGEG